MAPAPAVIYTEKERLAMLFSKLQTDTVTDIENNRLVPLMEKFT